MNYFVGFGRFDTKVWMVRSYDAELPRKGDEVFLIGWTDAEPVLVGIFTIGELTQYTHAIGIVPKLPLGLPDLPVPQQLFPEAETDDASAIAANVPRQLFPEAEMEEAEDGRWLHPVDQNTGIVLHRISQTFLDSVDSPLTLGKKPTRKKKEKGEKSPEQQVRDIEKRAKMRLGQAEFREKLVRAYGGCCAISECSVDEALSAAHILDYGVSECQEVWNGILLRADIHLLFDRHLFRIFPGDPPIVMLDPDIQKVEPYKDFHRRPIRIPDPFDPRTNAELRRRWNATNIVTND